MGNVGDASVATSAICLAEILQGLEERGSEKYWRRFRQLLQDRYQVARRYGLTLATLNTKDFQGIPGLRFESWE